MMKTLKKYIFLIILILIIATPCIVNAYCVQPNVMSWGSANMSAVDSRTVPGTFVLENRDPANFDEFVNNVYAKEYIRNTTTYLSENSNLGEVHTVTASERQEALTLLANDADPNTVSNELYKYAFEYQNSILENYYAYNYVVSATSYTDTEKMMALYAVIGATEWLTGEDWGTNTGGYKLYTLAMKYQEETLKSSTKDLITLTDPDDAKTTFDGVNLVYGPIYLTYPEGVIEDRREWGGFYYAFFDDEGSNAQNITQKIQLCTLENNQYVPITTTGEKDGFKKVTSHEYSGKPLYIVTTDRAVTTVYFEAYTFQIVRKARIVRYEGTATVPGGTWYCGGTTQEFYSYVNSSGGSDVVSSWTDTDYYDHSWSRKARRCICL